MVLPLYIDRFKPDYHLYGTSHGRFQIHFRVYINGDNEHFWRFFHGYFNPWCTGIAAIVTLFLIQKENIFKGLILFTKGNINPIVTYLTEKSKAGGWF